MAPRSGSASRAFVTAAGRSSWRKPSRGFSEAVPCARSSRATSMRRHPLTGRSPESPIGSRKRRHHVIAQNPWRRDTRLLTKQARIDGELERFSDEVAPDVAAFPREIAEILRFIHNHLFDSALNAAAARRSCGLRNNNVSTAFRIAIGLGLREYIEALRLQAAQRLLRSGDLEVYLVAMAVGYDHQETF